jgi:hypothetical protein
VYLEKGEEKDHFVIYLIIINLPSFLNEKYAGRQVGR